jgi:fibronectin type 3 domain-containing protein
MRKPLRSSKSLGSFCLFLALVVVFSPGCRKKKPAVIVEEPPNPADFRSVTITWTASTSKVAGYNVYRASPPGVPVKLTQQIVVGTEYTDRTAAAKRTYSYYVTSVDSKGFESTPSAPINVKVPAGPASSSAR